MVIHCQPPGHGGLLQPPPPLPAGSPMSPVSFTALAKALEVPGVISDQDQGITNQEITDQEITKDSKGSKTTNPSLATRKSLKTQRVQQ